MSSVHSAMYLDSCAHRGSEHTGEWGPVARTVAAVGYLLAVGIAFTSITGGILFLLG
ncbi:MAG: hypothetical protein Q7R40_05210 [Phaeospirillum sp.]|nr:hypothetical protein [Phaeospirillum sp.]